MRDNGQKDNGAPKAPLLPAECAGCFQQRSDARHIVQSAAVDWIGIDRLTHPNNVMDEQKHSIRFIPRECAGR
jgi:uncharacterized radical SAM superfamily protein